MKRKKKSGVDIITAIPVAGVSRVTNPPKWSIVEQSLSWPLSPSVVEFLDRTPGCGVPKINERWCFQSNTKWWWQNHSCVVDGNQRFDESNDSRHSNNCWFFMVCFGLWSVLESSNASVINRHSDGSVDLTPLLGAITLQVALVLACSLQTLQTNLAIDHWPFKW